MSGFFDTASNFHPYECDGPGKCIHCDRTITYRGEGQLRHHALDTIEDAKWTLDHDPATCALCDDGTELPDASTTPVGVSEKTPAAPGPETL